LVNDWLVIWRAPWKGEKKDAVGGRLPARIAGAPYIRSDRPPTVAIRRRLAIRRLMARWRQRVNDGFVAPYLQSLYGCLHPLGPPICPHLGVEVAWPSRTLWPAVALLVPVSVSPPPYRRAGKVPVMREFGCGVLVRQLGLDGRPVHTLPGSYLMRTATCASESRLEEK